MDNITESQSGFDRFHSSWYSLKMLRLVIFSIFLSLCIIPPVCADIYKFVDSKGVVHFTNVNYEKGYKKIFDEPEDREQLDYKEIVREKASFYDVDPSIINALIEAESGWDPNAISEKGAMGLMQIMPETAIDLGLSNPFDPEQNIDAGIRYFRMLLKKFNGNVKLAVAAYNAGPSKVEEYGGVPSFSETRRFIKNVLKGRTKAQSKPARIYRIVYEDGTVLYTNIPGYQR
jgi:soluble lytic murein transglycosylase